MGHLARGTSLPSTYNFQKRRLFSTITRFEQNPALQSPPITNLIKRDGSVSRLELPSAPSPASPLPTIDSLHPLPTFPPPCIRFSSPLPSLPPSSLALRPLPPPQSDQKRRGTSDACPSMLPVKARRPLLRVGAHALPTSGRCCIVNGVTTP